MHDISENRIATVYRIEKDFENRVGYGSTLRYSVLRSIPALSTRFLKSLSRIRVFSDILTVSH